MRRRVEAWPGLDHISPALGALPPGAKVSFQPRNAGSTQDELARLSTNSGHRVVDGATHDDLVSDEDAAATTSQAILDVVSAVRSRGALAR